MLKNSILLFFGLFYFHISQAQNTYKANIIDAESNEKLIGVSVKIDKTTIGTLSDSNGFVELKKIPNGDNTFIISYIGYKTASKTLHFPLSNPNETFAITLESEVGDLEEVRVTSTRTNSGIDAIAMKVEVLGLDDMNEENTIKPSNIASILGDLSVIQIQQTSAVNGNSVVRMQGLDGKYTQILRDGMPLYDGFSASFGILQIPPLDLKQVEIIKGSVSTLYGGGAISGLINLISKSPTDSTEATLTLNRSTLQESNVNAYFSKKMGRLGMTLFVGNTNQDAVDVNGDGFSDVASVKSTLVHPRIFVYLNEKTNLNVGLSTLFETRTGGDMQAIMFKPTALNPFYEINTTARHSLDANFQHDFNKNNNLTIKGTASLFNRAIDQSGYLFQGKQTSVFSEASYFTKHNHQEIVAGLNFTAEGFKKGLSDISQINDYNYHTFGFFAQDALSISDKFTIEAGLRSDFHNKFGTFILPRLAFLFHKGLKFSLRLSGGAGYKTPSIFTQQTLSGSFKNLLPLDETLKAEKSVGINCDINYKANLGNIIMQLNQAFYYTNITNPIKTEMLNNTMITLKNADYNVNSIGTDTYLRFSYETIELYVGYNHTIAKQVSTGNDVFLAFSPQDKFASTLVYEIPQKWRFGLENSYVANQYIASNSKVPAYWFFAAMIERKFKHISFVLNCENIFDYRQSKIETLYTGTLNNPNFKPLWAPIDGRVLNLSMRILL